VIAVRGPRLDTEDWPPNWGAESPIGPAWITGTLHGSERPIADLTLPTLFPWDGADTLGPAHFGGFLQ